MFCLALSNWLRADVSSLLRTIMEQLSSRLPISAGSMGARTQRLGLMARRSPVLTVTPAPEPGSRFFFSFGRYTGVVSAVAPERDHRDPGSAAGVTERNDGAAWT